VIYIRHTSFQLFHCHFPQQYLRDLYNIGEADSAFDGVTLNRTKAYDFCKVDDRVEWFDVFVALIQYLLSGESKVGFLNNSHPWNLIHKVCVKSVKADARIMSSGRRRWKLKDKASKTMLRKP
jgi:hypothetical protein